MRRAAAAVFLLSATATAVETERAEIDFDRGSYTYTFTAVIEGSSEAVRAVATDYDRLYRINDDIVESRVIERYGPHSLKRSIRMKYCILVFCFDMNFVEIMQETPEKIVATMVPEESTFEDGVAEWRIEAIDSARSRMHISARQTPSFWIPPVIGPMILKRVLLKEIRETCTKIEGIVQAEAAAGS
jgi:hypothetical protein